MPTFCTPSPPAVDPSSMPLQALCTTDFGLMEIDSHGFSVEAVADNPGEEWPQWEPVLILEDTAPDEAIARGSSSFDDEWLGATNPTFGYSLLREP